MAAEGGGEQAQSRRGVGMLLRLVLFNALLVAVPLGIYFVFYVDARVEQTNIRNFRALDAAAIRLNEIIRNLPRIAQSVPVGISTEAFADIQQNAERAGVGGERQEIELQRNELLADIATTSADLREAEAQVRAARVSRKGDAYTRMPLPPQRDYKGEVSQQRQLDARLRAQKEELNRIQFRLAAGCIDAPVLKGLNAVKGIYEDYLKDFRAVASATQFNVRPLRLGGESTAGSAETAQPDADQESAAVTATESDQCTDNIVEALNSSLAKVSNVCTNETVTRSLVLTDNGIDVQTQDCRSFSQRSPALAQALDNEDINQVLDRYGIQVNTSLQTLVDSVAANVAPLFDQYLIADETGRVLYTADQGSGRFRYEGVTGAPSIRRVRLDFVNHVDLAALVNPAPVAQVSGLASSLEQLGAKPQQRAEGDEWARFGVHSRIESFRVADITFRAFVHPFDVEGLAPLIDSEFADDQSTVLYMIGIVSADELSGESVRLRLSFVANALLAIGVLVAALPLLWLWTAGDRLTLTFRHLLLFAAAGLMAVFIYTLLITHLATRSIDDVTFDRTLQRVSANVRADFARELEARLNTLADQTAVMLTAGETQARGARPDEPPEFDKDAHAAFVRNQYACKPDPTDMGSAGTEGGYPLFDLAFLLDTTGKQWQCQSSRLFDTIPLKLDFREYYRRPRDNRLWHLSQETPPGERPAGLSERTPARLPGFFLDRITSILDGTTETVLAAHPLALCRYQAERAAIPTCPLQVKVQNRESETGVQSPVSLAAALLKLDSAVIIGRLHALEDSILPPHVRFAVVRDDTGETLFHSVRSRALATNFVRETEADKALLALMDADEEGFVDLDYYGTSVRAHVQPLAAGIPWTLVTYRDHELADTLRIMAISATTAYMLIWLVLIGLVALTLIFWYRKTSENAARWREAFLTHDFVSALQRGLRALFAVAALALVLLLLFAPQATGYCAGAMLFLTPLTILLVGRRHTLRWRPLSDAERISGPRQEPRSGDRHRVIEIFVLSVLLISVMPTVGVYVSVRSELSIGLSDYLRGATLREISARCERHIDHARRYKPRLAAPEGVYRDTPPESGVFAHGWALTASAPSTDVEAIPERCRIFPGAQARYSSIAALPATSRDASRNEVLQRISTFSALASDLAVRSRRAESASYMPGDIMVMLVGNRADNETTMRVGDATILLVGLLIGVALIWIVVVSISDRVLGMRLTLPLLPPARIDPLPLPWRRADGKRLRACVVHRSEQLFNVLMDTLRGADGFDVALQARWTGEKIVWEELRLADGSVRMVGESADDLGAAQRDPTTQVSAAAPPDSNTLFVVPGLERFIVDNRAGDALLSELERLLLGNSPLLVASRVVPGNWLANLTDQVSGDLANVTTRLALTSRWSQVLGSLDVRRLVDRRVLIDQRFGREMERVEGIVVTPDQYARLETVMLREAHAVPELLDQAAAVTRQVATAPFDRDARVDRTALQRFRVGAAGYFHTLWAASSREERLQLYVLAHGGFANPTQIAALSSLANRGLVATTGILRLRSAAFGNFIRRDLDHDSLLAWRDQGHGNIWKSIWPPILLIAILAGAFFVSSTPEALAPLAAILAASLGAIPIVGSLLRSVRDLRRPGGDD